MVIRSSEYYSNDLFTTSGRRTKYYRTPVTARWRFARRTAGREDHTPNSGAVTYRVRVSASITVYIEKQCSREELYICYD